MHERSLERFIGPLLWRCQLAGGFLQMLDTGGVNFGITMLRLAIAHR
jgi:hypothetical protein